MKKLFYLLAITLTFNSFGQNSLKNYEIGSYVDYSGKNINGYFDFDYKPETSLGISYNVIENFVKGYYLNNEGEKINGLLKYSPVNRELIFKTNAEDSEKSINTNESRGYVIGVDTFAVVKNVLVAGAFGDKLSDKSEFAEKIENIDGIKFYKFTAVEANGNPYTRYIVEKPGTSDFETFSFNSSKFIKLAIDIFGSDPVLKSDIEKGKYDRKDIPSIIKIFKYRRFSKNNQKIYFNSSWDEIENSKESTYYAKIEDKESALHLSYFLNNDVKIYEGDFTSFYPHNKQGDFLFYYPSGAVRRKLTYKDGKPKNAVEYFENGKTHRAYDIYENNAIIYKEVYEKDNPEVNLINEEGNGSEYFFDAVTGRNITYEYKNKEFTSAYFLDSNQELVYQLCKNNAEIKKMKNFQTQANLKLKYPSESIQNSTHGYVLVKCILEPSGLVSDVSLIKGLNPDCDKAVLDFLSCFKTEAYWKPGKENGEAVKQEIVFPIEFSIINTSSYRNNYYNTWYFNDMWWHQQIINQNIMQQQQWMNQQIKSVPMGRF